MAPILAPLAVAAGQTALSYLGSRLLGRGPKVPDFEAQTTASFAARRAAMQGQLRGALTALEDSTAAQGLTGTGGAAQVGRLVDASAQGAAQLAASEADALADARNRQKGAQFQLDAQRYQNRASGMAEILGGLGDFAGLYMAKKYGLLPGAGGSAGAAQYADNARALSNTINQPYAFPYDPAQSRLGLGVSTWYPGRVEYGQTTVAPVQ